MKRVIFLILILAFAACTFKPEPTGPAINTDAIAGYWSGIVIGKLDSGGDLPPRDIKIIIIADCNVGEVCGKLSEDDQCPGDIILLNVSGNQFDFISETKSGIRRICGEGNISMIDLELRPDGTIYFEYHNGATLIGTLQRK